MLIEIDMEKSLWRAVVEIFGVGLGQVFLFVLFGSIHNLGEGRTADSTAAMGTGALSMSQDSACQMLGKGKRIISALKTLDFSGS